MKKMNVILFFAFLLFLVSCSNEQEQGIPSEELLPQEPPSSTKTEKAEEVWPPSADTKGPWDGSLMVTTSSDGLTFEEGTLVLERAGVPNLLLTSSGKLILTYQFFSYEDEELFGVIAYSLSEDDGKTWSSPEKITLEDLPDAVGSGKVPMDPTLVETEDGALRLYFTYHAQCTQKATLYSATAADGDITSSFVVE